jgi:hypothetical protein
MDALMAGCGLSDLCHRRDLHLREIVPENPHVRIGIGPATRTSRG